LLARVNFKSDGLGLTPREYIDQLAEIPRIESLDEDYYSSGGVVQEIEDTFARLLGKEMAVFLPTGTLANHLALRALTRGGGRVLVQAESHVYNDSGDCAEGLSGLKLIPLGQNESTFTLSEVRGWVERSSGSRVQTEVNAISVETPVRRKDHQMFDVGELVRISSYARGQGIGLHLDGARLFNLPLHSGRSVDEISSLFDTVCVSLSKHFNAAAGVILAGSANLIAGMRQARRMFGGSMPHAWPTIALVPRYLQSYLQDYSRAWGVANSFIEHLSSDDRFFIQRIPNGTSRFLLRASGQAAGTLAARLLERGVILPQARAHNGIYPMQVNASILRSTPEVLAQSFTECLDG